MSTRAGLHQDTTSRDLNACSSKTIIFYIQIYCCQTFISAETRFCKNTTAGGYYNKVP